MTSQLTNRSQNGHDIAIGDLHIGLLSWQPNLIMWETSSSLLCLHLLSNWIALGIGWRSGGSIATLVIASHGKSNTIGRTETGRIGTGWKHSGQTNRTNRNRTDRNHKRTETRNKPHCCELRQPTNWLEWNQNTASCKSEWILILLTFLLVSTSVKSN